MRYVILIAALLMSCKADPFQGNPLEPDNSSYMNDMATEETGEVLPVAVFPEEVQLTSYASTPQLSDKIIVRWKIPRGVCYVRVFWFSTMAESSAEIESSAANHLLYERVTTADVSPKLSYAAGSFEHQDLAVGTDLVYIVKYYDDKGILLGYSEPATGSTARLPYGIEASKNSTEGKITVNWLWDNKWNCSRFAVYRSFYRYGDYSLLDSNISGDLRSFTDNSLLESEHGKAFYYKVSAFDGDRESLISFAAVGKTVLQGAPQKPLNLQASKGLYKNKISLSWEPPADQAVELDRYLIYYKIGTTWSETPIDNGLALTYDFVLTDGNDSSIQFYVCGANAIGEGVPSAYNIGFIIPKVTGITAGFLASDQEVSLMWDAVSIGNAAYHIYRSADAVKDASDSRLTASPHAGLSWSDTEATEGVEYYYFVTTVNTLSSEEGLAGNGILGLRGVIPTPVFSLSRGSSMQVDCTFTNLKDYLTVKISASRPGYQPRFYGKPMFNTKDGAKPANYEDALKYKVNPMFSYSPHKVIADAVATSLWSDVSATPGKNLYKVRYSYKGLIQSDWSGEQEGWREISDEEFLTEVLHTVNRSQFRMNNIHEGGMTAGNSEGPFYGNVSGECYYDANITLSSPYGGAGASVPITYTNYCDYYLTLNDISGNPQTSVANSNLLGHLHGGNIISGLYAGEVLFNLAVEGGVKSKGHSKHPESNYKVKRLVNGSLSGQNLIAWDFDRAEVEAYLANYPY